MSTEEKLQSDLCGLDCIVDFDYTPQQPEYDDCPACAAEATIICVMVGVHDLLEDLNLYCIKRLETECLHSMEG